MSLTRRRLKISLLIAVVAIAAWHAVTFIQAVRAAPKDAYAVWWTSNMVIEYMEHHQGDWPRSWEDLHNLAMSETVCDVEKAAERDGATIIELRPHANIEERGLVEVDWTVDPDKLLQTPRKEVGPPFRVIRLRNGKSTHYQGREPNQLILDYLQTKRMREGR